MSSFISFQKSIRHCFTAKNEVKKVKIKKSVKKRINKKSPLKNEKKRSRRSYRQRPV
jgi:hypothetical protein